MSEGSSTLPARALDSRRVTVLSLAVEGAEHRGVIRSIGQGLHMWSTSLSFAVRRALKGDRNHLQRDFTQRVLHSALSVVLSIV